jgi:hypothetical protein
MPEHRGLTYTVEREENDAGGYAYEFALYVEGDKVVTASQLEARGAHGPEDGGDNWTNQLGVYAIAYIDGLEAGINGNHSIEGTR